MIGVFGELILIILGEKFLGAWGLHFLKTGLLVGMLTLLALLERGGVTWRYGCVKSLLRRALGGVTTIQF